MIPKDGGNTFSGVLYADFTHKGWQASNLTANLKARGLTNVKRVYHISDYVGRVLDGTLPSSRWNPAQFFPGFKVQTWKDLSPRVGVAYDFFGDGRTALKWNIARYVVADGVSTAAANNPQRTIGRTDTRTWNDLNRDYTIYNPDGLVQWEELGPTTNLNFGKVIPSTTTQDPATLNGWNARGSTVEWQAVVQHQLSPRVALNAGYYFRWIGNQTATDNRLITNADFDGPLNAQRRVYDTCNAPILSGTAATALQVDNPEAPFCHQVLLLRQVQHLADFRHERMGCKRFLDKRHSRFKDAPMRDDVGGSHAVRECAEPIGDPACRLRQAGSFRCRAMMK